MYQWLFAKYYDKVMKKAEERGLREWRRDLLNRVVGDVLELGSGTGANLEFYPPAVERLVLIEPNPHMQKQLEKKLSTYQLPVKILIDKAESLSLADESFDSVVSTLVLCSVNNLEKVLSEIHRVLRPNGKLIFIEHVAAKNNLRRYYWQCRLEFLWKRIAAGCHLTRNTEETIANSGFKIIQIERQSMRGVPPIVRPSIRGIAIKS